MNNVRDESLSERPPNPFSAKVTPESPDPPVTPSASNPALAGRLQEYLQKPGAPNSRLYPGDVGGELVLKAGVHAGACSVESRRVAEETQGSEREEGL